MLIKIYLKKKKTKQQVTIYKSVFRLNLGTNTNKWFFLREQHKQFVH